MSRVEYLLITIFTLFLHLIAYKKINKLSIFVAKEV